jgi:hypothetical protein
MFGALVKVASKPLLCGVKLGQLVPSVPTPVICICCCHAALKAWLTGLAIKLNLRVVLAGIKRSWVTLPKIVPALLFILPVLLALLVRVNKPAVVKVAPVFTVNAPSKFMALPFNVLLAAMVNPPVPAIPLPLLVILPFTVAVMPVVVNANVLFMLYK